MAPECTFLPIATHPGEAFSTLVEEKSHKFWWRSKICVIIEGFGGNAEAAETRNAASCKKIFQISVGAVNNCAIVEGFAHRSKVQKQAKRLHWFIKNLQPISVGV